MRAVDCFGDDSGDDVVHSGGIAGNNDDVVDGNDVVDSTSVSMQT
jgi:hypothetical protein